MKLRLKKRATFSLNVKPFVNKVGSTSFFFRFYDDKNVKQDACDRLSLSGYHADTPITIKAEAIRKADSRSH